MMVLLSSKPADFAFFCPDFCLSSVDHKVYKRDDFAASQALLVAFICAHCPYVQAIEERLLQLAKAFSVKDLQVVGICANDADQYPEDAPDKLYERWKKWNYGFPYLLDEKQEVARAFDAQCTPDFFLFDQGRKLYYRGRLDDNWQDSSKVTKEELKEAIVALLGKKPSPAIQKPSMGCSIKWRFSH